MPELHHFCPGVPIILVGVKARDDFHGEAYQPEPVMQIDDDDLFVPFTIRQEMGSARYFFCDPRTGFGIRELAEYVRSFQSLSVLQPTHGLAASPLPTAIPSRDSSSLTSSETGDPCCY